MVNGVAGVCFRSARRPVVRPQEWDSDYVIIQLLTVEGRCVQERNLVNMDATSHCVSVSTILYY